MKRYEFTIQKKIRELKNQGVDLLTSKAIKIQELQEINRQIERHEDEIEMLLEELEEM